MARPNGPIVCCVINLKGGVGKSTIAALLARRAFLDRAADVLAIDLDPQANMSQGLMGPSYNSFMTKLQPSIVEIFNGVIPPGKASSMPGLVGPSTAVHTVGTIGANTLQIIPSRFDFSDALVGAVRPNPRVLAQHLAGNFQNKDLILIDCAPTESILTHAAYHASGNVLIPVKPEFFATIGFPLLKQSLDNFRKSNPAHNIQVAGVVINNPFYDGGNNGGPEKTTAMTDIRTESAKNGWKIFKKELPHSRGFPKIMRGDYSYPGNSTQFKIFSDEFFNAIGL